MELNEDKQQLNNKNKDHKNYDPIKILVHYLEIGGTMLSDHCYSCNSPLFRHHGNVFCPICSVDGDFKIGNKFIKTNINLNQENIEKKKTNLNNNFNISDSQLLNRKNELPDEKNKSKNSNFQIQKYTSCFQIKILNVIDNILNLISNEKDISLINKYLNIIQKCFNLISYLKKLN